ncbi:MAG: VanZ family protein [Bacteroides sp.]|nr:VanZ family protein [Bacteroides sp.]
MVYYFKKYPISIAIILVVIYLSFFKPPSINLSYEIPFFDKIVHFCMYFGMSGMLWWEFLRNHRDGRNLWHAWIGACVLPILFSGIVEILQETLTSYRGGDWFDFLANSLGALCASGIGYFYLRPRMVRVNI